MGGFHSTTPSDWTTEESQDLSGKDVTYYVDPDGKSQLEEPIVPFGFPQCPRGSCDGQALTVEEWEKYAWKACPREKPFDCKILGLSKWGFTGLFLDACCDYEECLIRKIYK